MGLKDAPAGIKIAGPSHLVVSRGGVRVVDVEDHVIGRAGHLACRDRDVAGAVSAAVRRVTEQRQQDLLDLPAVDVDQLQARGAMKGHAVGMTRTVLLHGAADDFIQVVPLPIELRRLREGEQVADDAGGARDVVAELASSCACSAGSDAAISSALPSMPCSGLLRSCARPDTSWPTLTSRSVCFACARGRLELVLELAPAAAAKSPDHEHDDQHHGQKPGKRESKD